MNKIIIIVLGLLIISTSSCVRPREYRPNALIEERVKLSLDNPNSYEVISTVIDSAFSPKDDPDTYAKAVELHKLLTKLKEYKFKAARAERVMKIWKIPHEKGLGHINYEKSKDDFEYYTFQIKHYSSEIDKLRTFLQEVSACRPLFMGYKVKHMYSAKDVSGNHIVGEKILIIDKTMKRILADYDSNDKEYQAIQRVYQEIQTYR